ncbi:MAG: hypothetical protein ACI80V_003685 [Rhodothermales bacterium]|jgi:hypothetical protein
MSGLWIVLVELDRPEKGLCARRSYSPYMLGG